MERPARYETVKSLSESPAREDARPPVFERNALFSIMGSASAC